MARINIFWFRRDLRLHDNNGLYHALKQGDPVLPVFIFDTNILDELEDKSDARVNFIYRTITSLNDQLTAMGSQLMVYVGCPVEVWMHIINEFEVRSVFANRDYEPYGINRDLSVKNILAVKDIPFYTYKDHVILEAGEVLKTDGKPYTVFTPYKRKWMEVLQIASHLKAYPIQKFMDRLNKTANPDPIMTLEQLGFVETSLTFPPNQILESKIKNYDSTRNFPALNGTSKLGIHFRFGTISVRAKAKKALALNKTFLNELIWRDFYAQILAFFPQVVAQSFKPAYDRIDWINNNEAFEKWCNGETGYPLVDAGMRELNASGYMHNRVRMVTASFLTKHLLIDWRWGEAYFAKKLLDFDLASNNGGWQWAAGSGTDAAPYFRIFNPIVQQKTFDRNLEYVKKWVPEYGTMAYPDPIVDHKFARARCLDVYQAALRGH